MFERLDRRWIARVLIPLGVFFLTRVVLLVLTGTGQASPEHWPRLFWRGLGFDLLVLAWMLAPLLIFRAFVPATASPGWFRRWGGRLLRWVSLTFLVWVACAEGFFGEEFSTRFNFIAVDYLIYTHEVLRNIWESYPVVWLIIGVASLALVLSIFIERYPETSLRDWKRRWVMGGLGLLLPLAAFGLGQHRPHAGIGQCLRR